MAEALQRADGIPNTIEIRRFACAARRTRAYAHGPPLMHDAQPNLIHQLARLPLIRG
jgi:hypothetical protein